MTVSEHQIFDVASAVWQSMIGLDMVQLDGQQPLGEGPYITATVLISGAYEGGVTLHMEKSVGAFLAAQMFGMELDEVADEETTDAVGELVNMVGGNLKALVAQPAKLSLPSVAEGNSYRVRFPGTEVRCRVVVGFDGGLIHIVVHARSDEQSKRTKATQRSVA